MRRKLKMNIVMKDDNVSQHHFENTIGLQLGLKEVGKEAKEKIIANYHEWKKKH